MHSIRADQASHPPTHTHKLITLWFKVCVVMQDLDAPIRLCMAGQLPGLFEAIGSTGGDVAGLLTEVQST